MIDMKPYKSINAKPETYERFRKMGCFGQTADDILNDMIDYIEHDKEDLGF